MYHFWKESVWKNFRPSIWKWKRKGRILTNKGIYARVRKPTTIEKIRLDRLHWVGHVQRMETNRIPKRVLYMNFGTTRLRGRPRNRWQDEVREDGQIVGGEWWQEKVHNREEWKKLLSTARNLRILHMLKEWMNVPCILYSLISRPTNAQHIYINNILYIISTPTCFMHLHYLQGVLTLYSAKVTILLKLQLNKISRLKCSCDRCWMVKYNL